MESQMVHPRGHGDDQDYPHKTTDPHLVAEAEDEHHPEKQSVMTKVRARARKIKDTIKKHVHEYDHTHDHDHDHDGDRVPDDHDLDEDEEVVEDKEIHGAPVYESAAIRTSSASTPVNTHTPVTSLSDHGISETKETDLSKTSIPGKESGVTMESAPAVNTPLTSFSDHGISNINESDPSKNFVTGTESRDNLGIPTVTTPISSFPDHGISNTKESDPSKTSVPGTESKVNLEKPVLSSFSPGISDTKESDLSKTFVSGTESRVNLDRPKGLEEDPHAPEDFPHKHTPSNYETKVTDPTGAGAEEVGVTPILSSFDKMNLEDGSEPKPKQNLANIGSSTGSHDQFSPEPLSQNPTDTPQHPQKVQENLDTLKPETNPHENTSQKSTTPTSYTQQISSATAVIADKAISAKNVVASKLGYGQKNETGAHETTGDHGSSTANKPASATEYGKKIATTVTDKPTPEYEKVAGAGSPVMSKMRGPANPENQPENTNSGTKGQDRRGSVKGYLAEKLRPGDEDKALSDVISDALHKRKPKPEKGSESHPMGKVTESEEVKRRLGSADERVDEDNESSYVTKLRGTVGSWFGTSGDQSRASQDSPANSQGETGDNIQGNKERKLQESGN